MTEEVTEKITQIVKALGANVGQENFMNLPLADLGLDSLRTMDLILSIEEAFAMQIPDEKLNGKFLRSVAVIVEMVAQLKRS